MTREESVLTYLREHDIAFTNEARWTKSRMNTYVLN